jgi:multidrug efflux system membrane fusion protein
MAPPAPEWRRARIKETMTQDTDPSPKTEPHASVASRPRQIGPRNLTRTQKLIGTVVALIVVGLLAVVVAMSLGGDKGGDGQQGGGPGGPGGGPGGGRRGGPASTVGVATASSADIPVLIEALGTVTPAATVTVRPQVSGVITQVFFREGQIVQRGQALAQIDSRAFQAQLTQAQGALQQNTAQLAAARVTLTRYETLQGQDSIAGQDVDTQRALVQQLEGAVTANRGAVQAAQLNLTFSRITAPVTGRIGLRVVDVGNYIGAGDSAGLAVITTTTPIDVEFTVPQDKIPAIQQRVYSGATLPVLALDRTRTTTLDSGTFSTLDNVVGTTTGTVRGKARFANVSGALFPSQFVNVRITLDTLKGAVVVPATAVRQGTDSAFVWLVKADNTVTKRPIVTGQATTTQVVISSGLNVGDKVITEGGDRLTEGGKVTVAGQAPARGARGTGQRRNRAAAQ